MIQPKPKPSMRNLTVSLSEEDLTRLDDYCRFLGGATDRTYVITEALREVIGRDRRFKNGRATDAQPVSRKTAGA